LHAAVSRHQTRAENAQAYMAPLENLHKRTEFETYAHVRQVTTESSIQQEGSKNVLRLSCGYVPTNINGMYTWHMNSTLPTKLHIDLQLNLYRKIKLWEQ
jgi:hypothetical protein